MAASADRNLLFGILALQMDFITRDQLVAAMSAWVLAKHRSLGEILVEQAALSARRRDLLEPMVAEHIAHHDGDPQYSLASFSADRSTRERFASIADPDIQASLGHVPSRAADADDRSRASNWTAGDSTSHGLRFRVLRPHAKGGLGVVYVAEDTELHREVALKEMHDHHADEPHSRSRFVLEAEITGGLEHPGIVPVYGLGARADGRPFYAMRFIRGETLKDAIAAFHTADANPRRDPGERTLALQNLLRRFLDVCHAIEYAHSRGVLHRDLKPDKIILGKYGETLVVDWGLAKAVGRGDESGRRPGIDPERTLQPSSASGVAETRPGSTIGTPAFMSPEQAAGRPDLMGPASDVYSLGATLYCLPTGRAPFEGRGLDTVLWDLSTGRVLDLRGHTGLVEGLACSLDGRRLATCSDDRSIKLWDTTTGEELFTLRGHTAGVLCVAFSPDGRRIASGGWDRTVRVWDTSLPASHAPLQRGAEPRVRPAELPADPFAR
jgi:serine/threonine-protein kinase